MMIIGLPDAIAVNTELELSCTVNRIKPEAAEMYWIINGKHISGNLFYDRNTDGKTFRQRLKLNYT